MIIDCHAHVFADMSGASGYESPAEHLAAQQAAISLWWGRMVSSTMDPAYMPLPGEDLNFRIGKYGRYYWTKHGQECWFQRYPLCMESMEWTPERLVANMDAIGVDVCVIQANYMGIDFSTDYLARCVEQYPNRLVSTIGAKFDYERGPEYLGREIEKIQEAVRAKHARGIFAGNVRGQAIDDPRLDPVWQCLSDLQLPHTFRTGFCGKQEYLETLRQIENVCRRFPDLNVAVGHLGGNVRHPSHSDYTDILDDFRDLLKLPNFFFEVGYVLAYENEEIWGKDYEYPYPRHQELCKRIYGEFGTSQLMWGSDMPNNERTCTYRQILDLVRIHFDFMSDSERTAVLSSNAAKLFRISSRAI